MNSCKQASIWLRIENESAKLGYFFFFFIFRADDLFSSLLFWYACIKYSPVSGREREK